MKQGLHICITLKMPDAGGFKQRLVSWLSGKKPFSLLDSNNYYSGKKLEKRPYYHTYDLLAAAGSSKILKADAGNAFEQLKKLRQENKSWLFGYFGYDLKNETEKLSSGNFDGIGLADMYFFVPEIVFALKGNELKVYAATEEEAETALKEIENSHIRYTEKMLQRSVLKPRISKTEYISIVEKLKDHIVEGDVYEVNFCQEYFSGNAEIEPFTLYKNTKQISPQPFSAFLNIDDIYVVCASMERFLKKEKTKLISQPIKGTIKRGANETEDGKLKIQLQNDEKERAENIMIVDLVRNDLARSAIAGTVKVEELCGIYPFPFVHQMISTVSAELNPTPALPKGEGENAYIGALKNAFPMGSMTGAPKIMAMNLIEKYESSKRGLYSGAIGYFTPDDDFDFNVVIRSFIYNASKKYLSLHVGSAITYDSDAEKEYEECLVKIKGLLKALE